MPIDPATAIGAELPGRDLAWNATDVLLHHLALGAGADLLHDVYERETPGRPADLRDGGSAPHGAPTRRWRRCRGPTPPSPGTARPPEPGGAPPATRVRNGPRPFADRGDARQGITAVVVG